MDDVAVIGVGLRFPGNATNPENLWDVLTKGESQWGEIPRERLNIDGYYHPSGDRLGSIPFRGAHLLKEDIAAFDATFFATTSDDARAIDPQQRLLLEISYEALENAGIRREDIRGTNTSVYVGSFVKDYEQVCLRDPDWAPQYAATGNGIAIMANRISYFYDLHGPSMTIDTGCSGSLVSVHMGVQSIRSGESSLAVVAGAGMILTPSTIMPMTALNFLSPDGKCFTFDSRANGYGRGEGVGVVILKKLADAIRDNDPVRAVIRGTSVNQDGRTTGITLPSKEAQVANIRSVYANAGLNFDQTAYVECHGTGTQAGDWRELKAISETLAAVRDQGSPIVVGSLKPNIGHLEGAAGVAGLIKGVLILENGKIPPNINFKTGNPDINFTEWKVQVPLSVMAWPKAGLKRVSVNCFGFGGTNAHVILDEAPEQPSQAQFGSHNFGSQHSASDTLSHKMNDMPPCTHQLFCYSASEKGTIPRIMRSHLSYIEKQPLSKHAEWLRNYAYTLGCRRSVMEYKTFFVASSASELATNLEAGGSTSAVRSMHKERPRVAFVFSGQGNQWAQMGLDLMPFNVFSRSLEEASDHLKHNLQSPFNLIREIFREESQSTLSQPQLAQPATTAIQVALVDLLHSFGINCTHVVGHSSGEIAAAYAAGAISRCAAWEIAYFRGMAAVSIAVRAPRLRGTMMSVGMSAEETKRLLASQPRSAEVACFNSPISTTISGRAEYLEAIARELTARKIFHRILRVDTAYHSSHMLLVAPDYRDSLKVLTTQDISPGVVMFSSVTGKRIQGSELGSRYWTDNMVKPVCFEGAVSAMMSMSAEARPEVVLEVGPRAALETPISETMSSVLGASSRPAYYSVMHSKGSGMSRLLSIIGELWVKGCPIELEQVFSLGQPQQTLKCLTDLPPYPWNHSKSYWHESHLSVAHRQREVPRQDLIGALTADSISFEPRWRGFLRISENPWIQDHQVQKTIIYPAAGMISMVLEGAKQIRPKDKHFLGYEITDMKLSQAMIVPNTAHGLEVAMTIKLNDDSKGHGHEFTIYSKQLDGDWEQHASGFVQWRLADSEGYSGFSAHDPSMQRFSRQCGQSVNSRQLYELLDTIGMNYGPTFQNVSDVKRGDGACVFKVKVPDTKSKMPAKFEYPHVIHPATLDSMFHSLFAIETVPLVPAFFESIFVSANVNNEDGPRLFSGYATAEKVGLHGARANLSLSGSGSAGPDVVIKGFNLTAIDGGAREEAGFLPNFQNLSNEIVWNEDADRAARADSTRMIELFAHKYPALSILQVGDSSSMALEILELVFSKEAEDTPRLSRFTVLHDENSNVPSELGQSLASSGLRRLVEFKQRIGDVKSDYHLIFVCEQDSQQLSELRARLKVGGLLFEPKNDARKDGDSIDERLPSKTPSILTSLRRSHCRIVEPSTAPQVIVVGNDAKLEETLAFADNLRISSSRPDEPRIICLSPAEAVENHELLTRSVVISTVDIEPAPGDPCCMVNWDERAFQWFRSIYKASKGIIWLSQTSHMKPEKLESSGMIGLARVLMSEDPRKLLVTLDLGAESRLDKLSTACSVLGVFYETFSAKVSSAYLDTEFAEQDGKIFIPRMRPIKSLNQIIEGRLPRLTKSIPFHPSKTCANHQAPVKLEITDSKLSDDAWHFVESPVMSELQPDEVDIALTQTMLTSQDLDAFLGRSAECSVGIDVRGRVTAVGSDISDFQVGDEVSTLVLGGTIQSSHRVNVKSHWVQHSMNGFAPSLYTSAYYGLVHMGRVRRKSTVLIQGGASAHGLAAIEIATLCGAETFATISGEGQDRQRQLLQACGLPASSIFDANSHELADRIRTTSAVDKFDVVYDTLEDQLMSDLKLVKPCGIAVRLVGKSADVMSQRVALGRSSGTIVNLDLRKLLESDGGFVMELMQAAWQLLEAKEWNPSLAIAASTDFKIDVLHEALHHVQQNPHCGICTVSASPEEEGAARVRVICKDTSRTLQDALDPHGTYVLAGGLGGLGRSIAELLVANGARHLAFMSRSGAASESCQRYVSSLRCRDIHVGVYCVNICDEANLNALVRGELAAQMPPVRGVFQCAAVIRDGMFDNMDYASWQAATSPKMHGSWNLVKALSTTGQGAEDDDDEDDDKPFFVFLASSAGVIGNRGQANYAAGNSFQDALAHHCRLQGTHAVSIDLGPVLGAGMLTESEEVLDMLRASGFYGIRHEDFLTVIKHAVTGEMGPLATPTPAQIILGVGTGGLLRQNAPPDPYWSRAALYAYLSLVDMPRADLDAAGGGGGDSEANQHMDLKTALVRAGSREEAETLVRRGLAGMLAKATKLLPEEMDLDKAPKAYGVDSLVAVGVRNWVLASCGVEVSMFEVLSNDSIAEMAAKIAERGNYGSSA
ncbi:polyketide synthase [Moelleriella libera RCEF 2490]|uniref:Polyketide synthase n=1 Tax=Moelleriella libera RCEF 2490 TaxID=1081109 RepID=A0A168ETC8_9HYPO|nr:polyketide synthase [Moelleriella libera RCEF 2490]